MLVIECDILQGSKLLILSDLTVICYTGIYADNFLVESFVFTYVFFSLSFYFNGRPSLRVRQFILRKRNDDRAPLFWPLASGVIKVLDLLWKIHCLSLNPRIQSNSQLTFAIFFPPTMKLENGVCRKINRVCSAFVLH